MVIHKDINIFLFQAWVLLFSQLFMYQKLNTYLTILECYIVLLEQCMSLTAIKT